MVSPASSRLDPDSVVVDALAVVPAYDDKLESADPVDDVVVELYEVAVVDPVKLEPVLFAVMARAASFKENEVKDAKAADESLLVTPGGRTGASRPLRTVAKPADEADDDGSSSADSSLGSFFLSPQHRSRMAPTAR